jgi:hypothetical protein
LVSEAKFLVNSVKIDCERAIKFLYTPVAVHSC